MYQHTSTLQQKTHFIQYIYFRYGKGFGILPKNSPLHKPNSLFGLMFYSMLATLGKYHEMVLIMWHKDYQNFANDKNNYYQN